MWYSFEDLIIRKIMIQSKLNLDIRFNNYSFFSFEFACILMMSSSLLAMGGDRVLAMGGDGVQERGGTVTERDRERWGLAPQRRSREKSCGTNFFSFLEEKK